MPVIVSSILSIISSVFGNISQKQKDQIALLLQQDENITKIALGQIETNTEEAKSSNLFIAGWRPAIGWTCALAFALVYFIQPLAVFICTISGYPVPPMPHFDMGEIMSLLGGLLGISTLRTYEKVKGLTK